MDVLRFSGAVEIQAGSSADTPARVSIVAYGGGAMDVTGFGSVAIDLESLQFGATIPLLADHVSTLDGIIGRGAPRVESGALRVEGELVGTPSGLRVRELAAAGIVLQASVGVRPGERVSVRAGEKTRVNGREIVAGPRGLTVVRAGHLLEVSVLPLGADSSTSVQIAAKAKGNIMSTETEDQADEIQAERTRVKAIRGVCGKDHRTIEAQAVDDGWTLEATKAAVLDEIRAGRATTPTFLRADRAHGNPRDILAASCMMMGGHGERVVKAFRGGEELANSLDRPSGWPELCATALRLEGLPVPSSRNELIRAAFSTTNLPVALGSSVQKTALEVFKEQQTSWRPIVRIVSAVNFRGAKAVRLAGASKLEKVGNDGEIKHGNIGEDSFDYKIDTYARMFGITRQDLINDDSGLLSDLPVLLGMEAVRSISDLFASTLIDNASGTWIASGHGNLLSGSFGLTELAAAVANLRTRKDADGRIIGFVPSVLMVPSALESEARQLLFSDRIQRDQSSDQQPMGNPLPSLNLILAVEPRLDADSASAFYLFAEQRNGSVLLALLDGLEGIRVEESQQDADMLGIQYRGYMDFGISLAEYRAVNKTH